MTTAIPVPAGKLRDMLTAVLPHAGRDGDLPTLNSVRFQAGPGVLYLAATDRHSLGVARHRVAGAQAVLPPSQDAWVRLASAQKLLDQLEGLYCTVPVTVEDGRVTIGRRRVRAWIPSPGDHPDGLPDCRGLLEGLLESELAPIDEPGYGIDVRLLARFCGTGEQYNPGAPAIGRVRIVRWFRSPCVLVTRADWFIGAAVGTGGVAIDDPSRGGPQWGSWAQACAGARAAAEAADPDLGEPAVAANGGTR